MHSGTSRTKILPSPICPVLAPFYNCIDGSFHEVIVDRDLESDFLEQVDFKLDVSVALPVPLLLAAPGEICHRRFINLCLVQCFFDVVEFMWLNGIFQFF